MPNSKALTHALTLSSLLIAPALSANTPDCQAIAAETVAELKAGAADWWTEDTARMAGMAAASACFKTLAKAEAPSDEVTTGETVADSDEESTEFMGLEVRPLSGPPSRKPYERTRD